jgi:hypothetical protein
MGQVITSAFMAKLLAPIPEDQEQADTKQFRAQVTRDMMRAWRQGMRLVEVAAAHHRIAADAFTRSGEASCWGPEPAGVGLTVAYRALVSAQQDQCLIPAPTPVQLRWKQRHMRARQIPDRIAQAIAADLARFAEGC